VKVYTTDEMNAAIARVEEAKLKHPTGWKYLSELSLPDQELVIYIFKNATAQFKRLALEPDKRVIYSVGWLNGIGVGVALAEQRIDS